MENELDKQTAVEWVLQYLNNVKPNEFCSIEKIKELLEQAKKMEKEQIEDAYADGVDDEYEYHINDEPRKNTEEYYLKKYGKTFIDLVSDEESKVHEVVRKLKERGKK
jgi:predicted transcriptional regulator